MRVYKAKQGSRKKKYCNYSQQSLKNALEEVKSGESLREVAKSSGIPKSTLQRKINGVHNKKYGGQKAFTDEEEISLVNHLIIVSDWGFPFSRVDLRLLVKAALDKSNKKIKYFKDNIPGHEWTSSFLKRHKNMLGIRQCQNIKNVRCELAMEDIIKYFEKLSETVKNVPPSHILNYDETNLSDDPGCEELIFRRGTKHPERIINYSKGATSIMFAGTAEGVLLEPYVVYKAKNMWNTWTEGGPPKTRYNNSKSGWFDKMCFEDWFRTVVVPWCKKNTSPKVLVGDNLSSHFSFDVLKLCVENQVSFVCLVPNTTHLTQPLDVSFFAPMKRCWRKILKSWKLENHSHTTLPKCEFPRLLKELLNSLKYDNLVSGFKACGIYPLNPNAVLKKFPVHNSAHMGAYVSDAVIDVLREMRHGHSGPNQKRRKMVRVEPGKSITSADLNVANVDSHHSEVRADINLDSISSDEESTKENYEEVSNKLRISDCVQVVKEPFKNHYAIITDESYGDELEINYFKLECGYYTLVKGDLDSRTPDELKKVAYWMDKRQHYFFKDL